MKINFNKFAKHSFLLLCLTIVLLSCKKGEQQADSDLDETTENVEATFKLSLAQWSLNKAIRFEGMNPLDFAEKADALGFEGLEYVSQLYTKMLETIPMAVLLDSIKSKSDEFELVNLLIMVDNEGDLASPEDAKLNEAVENHKKWVDAAAFLGCHSIRVNLFGTNDAEQWKKNAVQGLTKLSDYAATKNINILVENHGYLSSNAALLAEVMTAVNKGNCGTLPDFGNFCLKREGDALWDAKCIEEYDKYKGVAELMPFAKAVSAKSYAFDAAGNETTIDFVKMLQIVKDADYEGFIGVEFEGSELSEEEGIIATRDLLIAAGSKLN